MVSKSAKRPAAAETEQSPKRRNGNFSYLFGHVNDIGNNNNNNDNNDNNSSIAQNASQSVIKENGKLREAVIQNSVFSLGQSTPERENTNFQQNNGSSNLPTSQTLPASEEGQVSSNNRPLTPLEQSLLEETELLRKMYLASGNYLQFLLTEGIEQAPESATNFEKGENISSSTARRQNFPFENSAQSGNSGSSPRKASSESAATSGPVLDSEAESEADSPLSNFDEYEEDELDKGREEDVPRGIEYDYDNNNDDDNEEEEEKEEEEEEDHDNANSKNGSVQSTQADKTQDDEISIRAFASRRGTKSKSASPNLSRQETPASSPESSDNENDEKEEEDDEENEEEEEEEKEEKEEEYEKRAKKNASKAKKTNKGREPRKPVTLSDLQCHVCFRISVDKTALKLHLKTHFRTEKYECSICHKQLSSRGTLNVHKKTHEEENPFECPTCHKRLSTQINLQYHMQSHKRAQAQRRGR